MLKNKRLRLLHFRQVALGTGPGTVRRSSRQDPPARRHYLIRELTGFLPYINDAAFLALVVVMQFFTMYLVLSYLPVPE